MASVSFQGQAEFAQGGTITLRLQPDVPLTEAPPSVERIAEKIASGEYVAHESKANMVEKALRRAIQVQLANIQRGLRLAKHEWSDVAQQRLLAWLAKPVRKASTDHLPLLALLPAPPTLAIGDAPGGGAAPEPSDSDSSNDSSDTSSSSDPSESGNGEGADIRTEEGGGGPQANGSGAPCAGCTDAETPANDGAHIQSMKRKLLESEQKLGEMKAKVSELCDHLQSTEQSYFAMEADNEALRAENKRLKAELEVARAGMAKAA